MKTPRTTADVPPESLPALTETIASTLTIQLAAMPESRYFCTPIEERFERITRLARRALRVPVAAITLISGRQQWFKSVCGWPISQMPLEHSLCRLVLDDGKLTAVGDLLADSRTADNSLVTRTPKFRAYAGAPLLNDAGITAGTFCVFDTRARTFAEDDLNAVADLAAMAQRELVGEQVRDAHEEIVAKLGAARREAMVDSLTRLWNRRGVTIMLDAAISEAQKCASPLVVALIDLDNFKLINDTHGHQVGDEVLRRCAGRLVRSVRMSDIVGRIGGDEFILLLSDSDRATAEHVLNRLREEIASTPIKTRNTAVPSTISVGYTILEPGESLDAASLLERADSALRKAKGAGRDQVQQTG